MPRSSPLLAVLVLLSGCALPLPLSEGVMFAPGARPAPRAEYPPRYRPHRTTRVEFGVGIAATLYPPVFDDRLAARQEYEFQYGPNRLYRISLPGPQLGIVLDRSAALAFQVGAGSVGWSVNGTKEVADHLFLTANVMLLPLQGEAILQRRLLHHGRSGLSAGVFVRNEEQDDWLLGDDETTRVLVVGARAAYRFDFHVLRLHGYTSLGYAPEFDVPVLGIGLAQVFGGR